MYIVGYVKDRQVHLFTSFSCRDSAVRAMRGFVALETGVRVASSVWDDCDQIVIGNHNFFIKAFDSVLP